MQTSRIANVDAPVARVVLGWSRMRDRRLASSILDRYLEHGGNAIDTAFAYGDGEPEALLGELLAERRLGPEVVVIGKGAHPPHCAPEAVRSQVEQSLARLRLDRVPLYLLHRDAPSVAASEFVDALAACAAEGLVGAYGASNWTPTRVDEANAYARAAGVAPFVAVSSNFSLGVPNEPPYPDAVTVRVPDDLAWLRREGLALLAWSSQSRGYFSATTRADPLPDYVNRVWESDANVARRERATTVATRLGVSTTAVALAYVLCTDVAPFALVGPGSVEELEDSLNALSIDLDQELLDWLRDGGGDDPP